MTEKTSKAEQYKNQIEANSDPEDDNSELTQKELIREKKLQNDHSQAELNLKEQELEIRARSFSELINLRREYGRKAFIYNSIVTFFVMLFIAIDGSGKFYTFHLDVKVQIALISLLGVNSIGLIVIILKNLFPNSKNN
ncbi:hypothetical protein [Francisella philomiragia]|uniref:Uncharacterized protein n=1 Tax=Francisella philomiragia TaxID=28110 RepID=A0ABS1GF60_9GAMM|nr:hypothetical protein [Francisella philomiragia]MBK2259572.1 hypothetical protein [Francisella philomiragia]MBK2303264.1 hypothetical protein [Francisella philomiragia]